MRSSYFLYIAKHAGKNLLVILMGITLAVTLIDYLKHADEIMTSGNQTILYLFYSWEFRLSQFYPLAIVFAGVVTYMSLVRSHVWVSLRTFGYTRKQLFAPFFLPALILYVALLFLQTGEFSYARERAGAILHHTQSVRIVDDLFFKYNDSFVYVKRLDPIQKVLEDVTVFTLKQKKVKSTITLEYAKFDGIQWVADHAVLTKKRYSKEGKLSGFERETLGSYKLLKGYKPKVIELIYEGDSLSLGDAMNTYRVLKKQGLDADKIKASFYSKVFLPLFSLAILAILFFKTPYFSRYMNRELVWTLSLGGTLVLWGLLYALYSLSVSGTVSPELAVLFPVVLLLAYALALFINEDKAEERS